MRGIVRDTSDAFRPAFTLRWESTTDLLKRRAIYFFAYPFRCVTGHPFGRIILNGERDQALYLGIQPNNVHENPLLTADRRGLTVSVIDAFELAGPATASPAYLVTKPSDYHSRGIQHHWLPMHDHTDHVDLLLAQDTLRAMLAAYLRGEEIYVHCKSGVGRSGVITVVFICILYLAYLETDAPCYQHIFETLNISDEKALAQSLQPFRQEMADARGLAEIPDEALERLFNTAAAYVKSIRPELNVTEKRITGMSLLRSYRTEMRLPEARRFHRNPEHLVLQAITQSLAYKQLAMYASSSTYVASRSERVNSLQNFLDRMIVNAQGWYRELIASLTTPGTHVSPPGTLMHFCHADTSGNAERRELLMGFKQAVDRAIAHNPRSIYAASVHAEAEHALATALAEITESADELPTLGCS